MRFVVLSDFMNAHGGAGDVAVFGAQALGERGHDVLYISGVADDAPPEQAAARSFRWVDLGLQDVRSRSGARRVLDGIYNSQAADRLQACLAGAEMDDAVVLVHQWTRALSPSIFKALRSRPVVVFAHDYFLTCPNGAYFHFPPETVCTLKPMGAACILADCDRESRVHKGVRVARQTVQNHLTGRLGRIGVAFVSEGQAARFEHLYPKAYQRFVAPNVPIADPGGRAGGDPVSRREGVLFVGRLVSEKAVLQLAEAARAAGVACTFVGDGPMAEPLHTQFPDVRRLPWASRDVVFAEMRKARALVFPSLWPETFGLVVAEALAVGTPVAVSRAVAVSDDVAASALGVAFEPRDPHDFASALTRIASPEWDDYIARAQAYAASYEWRRERNLYADRLEAMARGVSTPAA